MMRSRALFVGLLVLLAVGLAAAQPSDPTLLIIQPPGPPAITYPSMGAADVPSAPTFAWSMVPEATSYDLQLSTRMDFSELVLDVRGLLENSYQPSFLLSEGAVYFLRVRALNVAGESRWEPASGGLPFATASEIALPPELIEPAFNASGIFPFVTFKWTAVPGAVAYDLQAAVSPLFESPVLDITIPMTEFSPPTPLPPNMMFFWRVRAVTPEGKSLWSPILAGWPFSTGANPPEGPTLLTPAKDEQGVATTPLFSWTPIPGAIAYQLQVSSTSMFALPEIDIAGIPGTSFMPPLPLPNSTTFFWRVRALTPSGGTLWSPLLSGQSFRTIPSELAPPELCVPAQGATEIPKTATFLWKSVEGATGYDLHVWDPEFLGGLEFTIPGIPDTTITVPPGALLGGKKYYWEVRAVHGSGNSPWSPLLGERWFETMCDPPIVPILNKPENGTIDLARTLILSWWNKTDSTASAFNVQVATEPTFAAPVIDRKDVPSTETVVTLDFNTTYYWRVQSVNPCGCSNWSDVWTFGTGSLSLPPPVLLSPLANAVNVPTSPTFTWEPSAGATAYDLQVATAVPFIPRNLVIDIGGLPGTTFKPLFRLNKSTKYFWRVRAVSAEDTSLWSPSIDTRWFITVPVVPATPSLVSPPYGTPDVPLQPMLCWESSPGATSYLVEVALDPGFEVIVATACGVPDLCWTVPEELSGTTTYYWRVKALNDGGSSPYSQTWLFTTMTGPATAPAVILHPAEQRVMAGRSATFVVGVKGTGPISYQWQKNGVDIFGATGPVLTLPVVAAADDGAGYHCIVSNALGTVASSVAPLVVTATAPLIVKNGDFEAAEEHWFFFTNGLGQFTTTPWGGGGTRLARLLVQGEGNNVQLFQHGITLEPNTQYRLSFRAFSKTGHDMTVSLQRHTCPYTSYGLFEEHVDLAGMWKDYAIEFSTEGFSGIVHDARLRFDVAAFDAQNDEYCIDDIRLEKINTIETIIASTDFESGTGGWQFYTDTEGGFDVDGPGAQSDHAYHVTIQKPGKNIQVYLAGLPLNPRSQYRLTFKAYTKHGTDLALVLHQHAPPYDNYGVRNHRFDLGTTWREFMLTFTASGFNEEVGDGRLRFWLAPFADEGDEYFFDDIVLVRIDENVPKYVEQNVLTSSFEVSTDGAQFYTDGTGSSDIAAPGAGGGHAFHIALPSPGSNTQFFYAGIPLDPHALYRLEFRAYSTTGSDLSLWLHQDVAPHATYGVDNQIIDLGMGWANYVFEFTTSGFDAPVSDGRLRFWLAPYAQAGEEYFFDDVKLAKLVDERNLGQQNSGGTVSQINSTVPAEFLLQGNYPNPFNPSTSISYGLPEPSTVSLKVYNMLGQEVATLAEGTRGAGYHTVSWDARGGALGSGMYIYRLTASGVSGRAFTDVRRMLLLK